MRENSTSGIVLRHRVWVKRTWQMCSKAARSHCATDFGIGRQKSRTFSTRSEWRTADLNQWGYRMIGESMDDMNMTTSV